MAAKQNGGVSFELTAESLMNLNKQFSKLDNIGVGAAWAGVIKVLNDIKNLAQLRLKSQGHIVTSRLRNSIYFKTYNKEGEESANYSSDAGSFSADFNVGLGKLEGAVGTNVEYAAAMEFGSKPHTIKAKDSKVLGNKKVGFFGKEVQHPGYGGDSYLYWASKHVDTDKTWREVGKEILNMKI